MIHGLLSFVITDKKSKIICLVISFKPAKRNNCKKTEETVKAELRKSIKKWMKNVMSSLMKLIRLEDAIEVIKQYEQVIMAQKRKLLDGCSNKNVF